MTAAVTVSRSCAACGGPLTCHRSHAVYCSNACRQRAYRSRQERRRPESVTLTPTLRAWLKAEIDRQARERLKTERARLREETLREGWGLEP
jgi:hypothetical protein